MVRIVHISDLHFGAVMTALVDPLLKLIHALAPRLVVVSGDITQRAREWQFAQAAAFLKRIRKPTLVVPGNHDVPLWNLYNRFFNPLELYKRYISADLDPEYMDKEILILGVNTVRSFAWKGGRISLDQILRLETRLKSASPELFKAVVMHHPIIPLERAPGLGMVGRAEKAVTALERAGAALIMAGHGHNGYVGKSTALLGPISSSILVVHAGTTLSTRTRGTLNSFNVLNIQGKAVELIVYEWEKKLGEFVPRPQFTYENLGLTSLNDPDILVPEILDARHYSDMSSEKP